MNLRDHRAFVFNGFSYCCISFNILVLCKHYHTALTGFIDEKANITSMSNKFFIERQGFVLRHNKLKNVLLMSVLITVLVSTSLGGAFASAAQAATPDATPDETIQNNREGTNKAVVGGVLAVGLIAALVGHHSGHDKSEVSAE